MSRLQAENEQLKRDAYYDKLTGLYNRAMFGKLLDQEWSEIEREEVDTGEAVPFSLLYMDLDDFKAVNDNYGHPAGDDVLRSIGQAIDGQTRQSDFACRIGGDEFVMALPSTSADGALEVANKLLGSFSELDLDFGHQIPKPGLSIGIGTHKHGEKPDKLLSEADTALLSAKKAGKGGIVHFDAIKDL